MGLLKQRINDSKHYRFPYNAKEFFSPRDWFRQIKHNRQRKDRGWSDRDTWGGGEYIMTVTVGVLHFLENEQNVLDWDEYFASNYVENYGYTSLSEVADDIDNYLYFQENSHSEEYDYIDSRTQFDIEYALYEQAKHAMKFVAENIGGLWW